MSSAIPSRKDNAIPHASSPESCQISGCWRPGQRPSGGSNSWGQMSGCRGEMLCSLGCFLCQTNNLCVCKCTRRAGHLGRSLISMATLGLPEQGHALATSALTQLGSTRGLTQHCFLEAETVLEPLWPTAPVLSRWHLHQSSCRNQTLGSCVWRVVLRGGGLSSPPNPHQQLFPCLFSSTHPSSASPHHRCHPRCSKLPSPLLWRLFKLVTPAPSLIPRITVLLQ